MLFRDRSSAYVGLVAAMLSVAACGASRDAQSPATAAPDARITNAVALPDTDDFGTPLPRDASLSARVVSLNPTATEIIFALGQEQHLVGRSRWDAYPPRVTSIADVGDGIRPNVEAVLAVRPTLVILYATAENRPAARALAEAGVPTIALRVDRIAQFESLTRRLGVALGASPRAAQVIDTVQATLTSIRKAAGHADRPPTVVWPLWQSPVMVVGRGSYLNELIDIVGARNVFDDLDAPSPIVSIEEIARRDPTFVVATQATANRLLASPAWRAVRAVREGRIVLDDPSLTGRPSVVLGMAAHALAVSLDSVRGTRK